MKSSKTMLPKLNTCRVGIIGLGYVGLPLALQIAKTDICLLSKKKINRQVLGYDLNQVRIDELKKGCDRNNIFSGKKIKKIKNISFTNEKKLLKEVDIFIITVPTPINKDNQPDLFHIKEASKLVGGIIKSTKNNPIIIYESTVYPGLTEEICVPIIEKESGKIHNSIELKNSFYCGYSPERINPGDKEHTIDSIVKITSGCNSLVSEWIDNFYGSFISAGTFKASNIRVAEAAKIIENTQRDINIALVNELSILFRKLNLNTKEVLDAAGTKWNFHKYIPGLVGGHCIGVAPYYLTFKAKEIGFDTKLISAGRKVNDYMYEYLLEQIILYRNNKEEIIMEEEVLLFGVSYKSNCADIRNSQLINLVEKMKEIKFKVSIFDPKVNKDEVLKKTGLKTLSSMPKDKLFTIIIFALNHNEFQDIKKNDLLNVLNKEGIIFDLTNNFTGKDIINF